MASLIQVAMSIDTSFKDSNVIGRLEVEVGDLSPCQSQDWL